MNCPTCQAKTTETRGSFVRRKGQPSTFVAGEREDTIRTACPKCGRVIGYRPGDVHRTKTEAYQ